MKFLLYAVLLIVVDTSFIEAATFRPGFGINDISDILSNIKTDRDYNNKINAGLDSFLNGFLTTAFQGKCSLNGDPDGYKNMMENTKEAVKCLLHSSIEQLIVSKINDGLNNYAISSLIRSIKSPSTGMLYNLYDNFCNVASVAKAECLTKLMISFQPCVKEDKWKIAKIAISKALDVVAAMMCSQNLPDYKKSNALECSLKMVYEWVDCVDAMKISTSGNLFSKDDCHKSYSPFDKCLKASSEACLNKLPTEIIAERIQESLKNSLCNPITKHILHTSDQFPFLNSLGTRALAV